MSNLLRFVFCVSILLISIVGNIKAQSAFQYIKSGDKYVLEGDYFNALDAYYNAWIQDSLSPLTCYKYAEALRLCNSYEMAIQAYDNVLQTDTRSQFKAAKFYKAIMLKYEGNYVECKSELQDFISSYKISDSLRARALFEMESVSWALDHLKDSSKVKLEHLPDQINTGSSEFGVFIIQDSLVHFSRIEDWLQKVEKKIVYKPKSYHIKNNQQVIPNKDLPGSLDSSLTHYANYSYDPRFKILYFTACENINVSQLRCKIKFSKWVNNSWSEPEFLSDNLNTDSYTYTQPAIAFDTKDHPAIYISSDMKGGKGGMDIWRVMLSKDMEVTSMENVQGRVNTMYNEITPFVDQGGNNLYFSSDGHSGYGGYDVYKISFSSLNNRKLPQNVGLPINSSRNDVYYFMQRDSTKGYFSSNRAGSVFIKGEGCCNDLYVWTQNTKLINLDSIRTTLTYVTSTKDTITKTKNSSVLEEKLPITVYFHNDIPNPKTIVDTTFTNYKDLYEAYSEMKYTYLRYFQNDVKKKEEVSTFFSNKVDEGFYKLMMFISKLKTELENGKSFVLGIQAYCSPLAQSDYNNHLANRRIASVVNYINHYQNGALQKYIKGQQLKLEFVPYGESKAPSFVNDDIKQVVKSIYDPSAAAERRVSIIYIKAQ